MSWGWLTLNLAYLVYAISGIFKEVLRLRTVLLMATVLFIVYGLVAGIWSVVWWNIPVLAVHGVWVWRLTHERQTAYLSDEAQAVHTLLFRELDAGAFATFWRLGDERTPHDQVLLRVGEPVPELSIVIDGQVVVELDGEEISRLGPLRLVGEMSSIDGGAAAATVRALGRVRLRSWDKQALAALCAKRSEIDQALLRAYGREMSRKLA